MTAIFFVALFRKDNSIVDVAWGPDLIITLLLIRLTGIPLLEKKCRGNPEFEDYARRTNPFSAPNSVRVRLFLRGEIRIPEIC
jgi:steroid 5-alpha reductase family enzyme